MATNLFCNNCKSTSSLKAKLCRKCGQDFGDNRKYRVVVKFSDGSRVTKVLDSLKLARKLERELKVQATEKKLFGISKAPLVDGIWEEYLKWAKQNKKMWKEEELRWKCHIEPHLKGKTMDAVIPHDISNLVDDMKSKRDYAPATIKLVLFLTKRLYNWAAQMGLYEGKNPAASIKSPRLNNEVTECLTRDEIKSLMVTLEGWENRRVALVVKFALYTGLRKSEIFGLKWENVDLINGLITLRNTKGGKDEILPLSDEALKIVIEGKQLCIVPDRSREKRC
jgi:integrase